MGSTRTHTQKTKAKVSVKNTPGKKRKVEEAVRKWGIQTELSPECQAVLDKYRQGENTEGKKSPCPLCKKEFTRSTDVERHVIGYHFNSKQFKCVFKWLEGGVEKRCSARYAQSTALYTHIESKHAGGGKLPCKEPACKLTFHDASSKGRHYNEQHIGKAYECPYLDCRAHDGQPKRIKRGCEFKNHLKKSHGIEEEDVKRYKVQLGPKEDGNGAPKKRSRARRSRNSAHASLQSDVAPPPYSGDGRATTSVDTLPLYCEIPNAGETQIICSPDDVGQASTPGLSFSSPSPSPSGPDTIYSELEQALATTSWSEETEDCGAADFSNFPMLGNMPSFPVEEATGVDMLQSQPDSYHPSYANNVDLLTYGNLLTHANMGDTPSPKDTSYDPFAHLPYPVIDFSQPEWLPDSTPTGYQQLDQAASWSMAMPIPEPACVYQPNMIVPPSLPHLTTAPYGMYNRRQ